MELLAEPQSSMRRMLFDFVVPTGIPNLHLLPCGHAADGFWESFCSDKLKDLLEVVKDSFDLILIDTAPLLVGPDARLQAQAADGVVLVLRAGASKMQTTQAALSQLAADRTPVLGTIFNDWDPTGKEYAYDSYARN